MSNLDLAKDFTTLLKEGHHQEAAERFNADDIVSYEPMDGPMAVCTGKEAVKGKSEWWFANHEVHAATAEGPYVNGDTFVVRFAMDVTPKQTGQRMQMDEVGLYTIRNGKIAEERFFYGQG